MSTNDVRAVQQLVALCVRPRECRLPAGEAEWDALLPLALAHGVAPLLYVHLKDRGLPERVLTQLRSLYFANSFRNTQLLSEQARILAAFTQRSISAWPLKGPQLSEHLFGDAAVRQVADMDLLIRPEDLAACDRVLQEIGYARQVPGEISRLRDAGELVYLKEVEESKGQTVEATRQSITFAVDLQQRVLPYGKRDLLAGRIRAAGMTPENLLLLLCVNQIAHRFARLKYLLDVAACLRKLPDNFAWETFTDFARQLDYSPGIYLSLSAAQSVAGAKVPEFLLKTLRPGPLSRRFAARALGADPLVMLARGAALDGPAGAPAILACTRPGPARWRQAWWILFPPAAYLRQEFSATPGRSILSMYFARLARKLPAALRRHR